ncbi:hypothetical protein BH11BAC4_BH11BAC4_09280 [soil metagenome]
MAKSKATVFIREMFVNNNGFIYGEQLVNYLIGSYEDQ